MRVHHLNCGTMCPHGGGWIDGGTSSVFSRSRLVCHVLLIETDASGLVLVDSGLGLEDVRHPRERLGRAFVSLARPVADESDTAIRQIEALGFDASDVRHIVPTHMDLDHVGALTDFPDAVVHLTKGAGSRLASRRRRSVPKRSRIGSRKCARARPKRTRISERRPTSASETPRRAISGPPPPERPCPPSAEVPLPLFSCARRFPRPFRGGGMP